MPDGAGVNLGEPSAGDRPVLSHMAEDIWSHLPYKVGAESVFQAGWLHLPEEWNQPHLSEEWDLLRGVRDEVNKSLEAARSDKLIGASAEAKVVLKVGDANLYELLSDRADYLRYLFIVSQVELSQGGSGIEVEIQKAEGSKCVRCWNYSTQVGSFAEHPELCERCVGALAGEY